MKNIRKCAANEEAAPRGELEIANCFTFYFFLNSCSCNFYCFIVTFESIKK